MDYSDEIHLIYGRIGAENFVLPIANTFQGKSIIYCQSGEEKATNSNIKIKYLPKWFDIKISLKFHFLLNFIPSCIFLYFLFIKNRRSKLVVHMNTFALFPLIIAKIAGIKKRTYFNHGFPFVNALGVMKFISYIIEFIDIVFATDVITVSPKQLTYLKNNVITKIKEIKPIYPGSCCGISISRIISNKDLNKKKASLYLNENNIYITYIGRPFIRKGFPYIIYLFEYLTELIPEKKIRLQIIGISRSLIKNALKNKSKINLIDSISYTNNVDYYLKKSHITVLPSTREAFGYALLEGAAQGNALAIFDICGPNCLVKENYNGIIVNKNSTYMQFAEKLEGILERPNTLSFLMNNSRKSAYFFNEIKILKSVREFL